MALQYFTGALHDLDHAPALDDMADVRLVTITNTLFDNRLAPQAIFTVFNGPITINADSLLINYILVLLVLFLLYKIHRLELQVARRL